MGNQQNSSQKIVILDDVGDSESFKIPKQSKYQFQIFTSFEQFTEMKNVKNIRNIILRYEDISIEERMEEIDYHNEMVKVCPMILVNRKSMKQNLFNYLKKLSVNPNIFLFTKDIYNVKIEEHEKPYITKIVDNINTVISIIEENRVTSAFNIKMNRMAKDMYRKIMVKIIDPRYIKDETKKRNPEAVVKDMKTLKQSGISFEYFNSVEKFEKSSISTITQYVIVQHDQLTQILDSRKLLKSQYEIILRHPILQQQSEQSEILQSSSNQLQRRRKKISNHNFEVAPEKRMKVWLIEKDLREIIKKIQNCSSISADKKPMESKNTLICGDDEIFKEHFQKIKKKVQKQFEDFKPGFLDKTKLRFMSYGTSFEAILREIKKDIYSYVVVFEPGPFLEELKSFLKKKKFNNRVQLTKLPETQGKSVDEIIDKKVRFLVHEINYKIKFEIAPIINIHAYQLQKLRVDYLKEQMGIDVIEIKDIDQLFQKYCGPIYQKIIQSELIVCSVQSFQKYIKPRFKRFKGENSHLAQIKYILVGQKGEINKFTDNPKNYCQQLAYIHVSMRSVKNFLDYQRRPAVSIPFFGKGVLSNFHSISKKLLLQKGIRTMKIRSSVISTNRVLNQIFENKIRISTEYQIGIIIFPESKQGMRKVIEGYEQMYLGSLAKLFTVNYDILEKKSKKQDGKQFREEYINIEILKEDIEFSFKRSKVYELLSVSRQDFKEFYLKRIQQSNSLIDLQIACIYTLSLPHGFDKIIAALFNDPRRYQLLNKIFCQFIVVLLTTFYTFHQETIQRLELVSYVEEESFHTKLQSYEPGNIFYNTTFIFCRANNPQVKDVNKNTLIFLFENIEFLQKKKIRNNLYIQPYSFYKEGCEYLIPPQTKFRILKKNIKANGHYEIFLEEVEDYQGQPFIGKILTANNITSEKLANVLKDEVNFLSTKFEYDAKRKIKSYDKDDISLYKKVEAMNVLEGKRKLIEQSKKSINSMEFFYALKQKKYLSAMLIIGNTLNKIQIKGSFEKGGELNEKKTQKMMEIELSLLHFKMSEYSVALKGIKKILETIEAQKLQSSKWTRQTLEKFQVSTKSTFSQRKQLFEKMKKTKRWSIQPVASQNDFEFKIKPKSEQWNVKYEPEIERFNLVKMGKCCDRGKKHYPAEPENEFGSLVTGWINLHPYEPYDQKDSNKQLNNLQKPAKSIHTLYEAQRNAGFEQSEKWQVFHLGSEVKVVNKKKRHFHKKGRKQKLNSNKKQTDELNLEVISEIKQQKNNSQFIHTAETLGGGDKHFVTPSKMAVSNFQSETKIDFSEMIGTQSEKKQKAKLSQEMILVPEDYAPENA